MFFGQIFAEGAKNSTFSLYFDQKNDDVTHENEKIRKISAALRPFFVTNFHVAKAAGPLLLPHW